MTFHESMQTAMIERQEKIRSQRQRAAALVADRHRRIGDLVSLGEPDDDNYIVELITNGSVETYWSVVVNGDCTSELFSTKAEALVRWVDVTENGRTSRAHEWAMKLLKS